MTKIKLENFGGMLPVINETLLPDTGASYSLNTWMYSGALLGLRQSIERFDLDPTTRYVYRIPLSEEQPYNYTNSFYMEFTDPLTTVVRSSVFNDTYYRYYWCSPTTSEPRMNTKARIIASDPSYKLGVPAPSNAPGVSVAGGAPPTTTRVYCLTWVSTFGEESAPSDPTTFTGNEDGTWNITMTAPTVGESTDRTLDKVRIYRQVTTSSGVPVFFRVTELAVASTAHADTASNATVAANAILESFNWEPPPDLDGFVMAHNGILVGWRENEVWFSEPYRPHAWPPEYVLTVEYPIVNIGVLNQTLIVLTKGNPFSISGNTPANMTPSKYMAFEPCLSRSSMVASETGVFYASPNGLINAVPGSIQNVTREIIERNQWLENFNAEYLFGARLNSAYFAFGSVESGCFQTDTFQNDAFELLDYTGARQGFYLDTQNTRVGVNLLEEPVGVLSAFEDPWSGDVLYVSEDHKLYSMHPSNDAEQRYYIWRSKAFQMQRPNNMSAIKVRFLPTDPEFGQEPYDLNDPNTSATAFGWVRVYADGRKVLDRELTVSGRVDRIPSGYKAEYWVIEIEARVRVMSIEFAGTARELVSA